MASIDLYVDRHDVKREQEVSAWSWRAVVLLIVLGAGTKYALDPSSGPFGAETWPAAALGIVRVVMVLAVIEALRRLVRAGLALTTLLGHRPLVSIRAGEAGTALLIHGAFGRTKQLRLVPGSRVTIAADATARVEHRGRLLRADQLCDWLIGIEGETTKVEMAWAPDRRVIAELAKALAPSRITVVDVPVDGAPNG